MPALTKEERKERKERREYLRFCHAYRERHGRHLPNGMPLMLEEEYDAAYPFDTVFPAWHERGGKSHFQHYCEAHHWLCTAEQPGRTSTLRPIVDHINRQIVIPRIILRRTDHGATLSLLSRHGLYHTTLGPVPDNLSIPDEPLALEADSFAMEMRIGRLLWHGDHFEEILGPNSFLSEENAHLYPGRRRKTPVTVARGPLFAQTLAFIDALTSKENQTFKLDEAEVADTFFPKDCDLQTLRGVRLKCNPKVVLPRVHVQGDYIRWWIPFGKKLPVICPYDGTDFIGLVDGAHALCGGARDIPIPVKTPKLPRPPNPLGGYMAWHGAPLNPL